MLPITLFTIGLLGCTPPPPTAVEAHPQPVASTPQVDSGASSDHTPTATLLAESWRAYKQRFIQSDGRVIDREDNDRTVSEGQAYAMLRAVLANDPTTFEQTLHWAEDNLQRPPQPSDQDNRDHLWAWKWGQRPDGSWGVLDSNFASDADLDAATALILAARRWQRPDYLDLARQKLADLWRQGTLAFPTLSGPTPRYLLPGPLSAFQPQPGKVYINPSYLAPYAFRLFAQVDAEHDWMALVDSSYRILEQTDRLSPKGLPADWVLLDMPSQQIQVAPTGPQLQSRYSYDAYRVWWRVGWDAVWFDEPRARTFLATHLTYLKALWQQQHKIAAVLDLAGNPQVDYEATSQYAMLVLAFQQTDPAVAAAIRQQKLLPAYHNGIWDNDKAYYVQNLAWLGLFPAATVPQAWLHETR